MSEMPDKYIGQINPEYMIIEIRINPGRVYSNRNLIGEIRINIEKKAKSVLQLRFSLGIW